MGLFKSDKDKSEAKIHRTLFGKDYTVRIWTTDGGHFSVTSCMGFAGYNFSLALTDYRGCSTNEEVMSNFKYSVIGNQAVAKLNSMFKFPEHNTIHLQCAVVFCEHRCPRLDCDRKKDDPFPHILDESPSFQRLVQERFASTTVRVDDVGNRTEYSYLSTCGYHHQLLAALCILFACLFGGAVCINCIFCALSGYCCCRPPNGSESGSVQYVTTDLKTIDSLHNPTIRPYPHSGIFAERLMAPSPFYYSAAGRDKMSTRSQNLSSQHSPASSGGSYKSDTPIFNANLPPPPPRELAVPRMVLPER